MRMAAPQYIRDRRLADARWVRRNERSLGGNRQFRACVRMDHEARKEFEKLRKEAEQNNASSASQIVDRLNSIFKGAVKLFTPRRTQ
jgi:hypothetical protein